MTAERPNITRCPVARTVEAACRYWPFVLFGLATAIGLLNASQLYVQQRQGPPAHSVLYLFARTLLIWWMWAVLTPVIFWVSRRVRLDRTQLLRAIGAHLAAAVSVSAVHTVVYVPLILPIIWPDDVSRIAAIWYMNLWNNTFGDLLTYFMIAGAYYAAHYYARYRDKELTASRLALQTSQLEVQLSQARLDMLKTQLQPHFLFNALNSISTLVLKQDTKGAARTIVLLGRMLRASLDNARRYEVPLHEEISLLRIYIELEQVRFSEALSVGIQIAPDANEALVPNLILQPLVENAIRHGVAKRATSGRVEILAHRDKDRLVIQVFDDGPDQVPSGFSMPSPGVGLSNARARLERMYAGQAELSLDRTSTGGTVARIVMPFVTERVARSGLPNRGGRG